LYVFFRPQIQVIANDYQLHEPLGTKTCPTGRCRVQQAIPLFDIDSGLYFDKNVSFYGTHYRQTLEPRFFFLYVPYQNQQRIPVFDTAIIPFSYYQLFNPNRFSGLDRVGDAKQLSIGITTRFINQNTGFERFSASIGEIAYFQDRRVTLCRTPGCGDPLTRFGALSPTEKLSPLAALLSYHVNSALSLSAELSWNIKKHTTHNALLTLQYRPHPNQVIDLNYTFIRHGGNLLATQIGEKHQHLNQAGISVSWPITFHWQALAHIDFDLTQHTAQTAILGVKYQGCCYSIALAAGRLFSSIDNQGRINFNNAVYLQFKLKGLGSLGTGNK